MFWKYILRCPTYIGPSQSHPFRLADKGHHVGDFDQSHLTTLPFPSRGGVWATPKRYVGHIGLDINSRAQSGPSWTCAPFAPTMSVRILCYFLPFPIFLAQRALSSTLPCTPDAWTDGPHMVVLSPSHHVGILLGILSILAHFLV